MQPKQTEPAAQREIVPHQMFVGLLQHTSDCCSCEQPPIVHAEAETLIRQMSTIMDL